ncbi:transketolase C-terminal domain-containing protein, partial [Tepidanaerobacter syntrophicus]|uniref:transketolase C-terminal domain-containing protein n=2 Tax=Tepidanaerobacteraceae TaxID=2770092 RepID=UPI0023A8DA2D
LKAAEILKNEGLDAMVVNISTLKPIDEDIILDAAKCKAIVTAEEHSVIGGLGSAVAEVLSEKMPTPMYRVGIRDQFGQSGKPEELLKLYHLTAQDIAEAAKMVKNR